ncbi:MAG: SRPBCC domain-containing protein [Candidatus Eisenbacteria bacterium]|uniref:SRPBCC domain-containing protein n=1 Tax=Eiseniibacteriota bacterium TaxID=2212470 RepID=A0A7Y2E917_UNCEI|nr:SRPBCC domain-containing protein [Candidatus Eisenbacteria bacterium]
MRTKCEPDHSARPLTMTVERLMKAGPSDIYQAWTQKFDTWFAEPGELLMTPEVDKPFFFYNRKDWGRHPHYGRFLELKQNELVELAWATEGGTEGAETVIRVELSPREDGTLLRLTHSGFCSEKSRDGHAENWPEALEVLDHALLKFSN